MILGKLGGELEKFHEEAAAAAETDQWSVEWWSTGHRDSEHV